MRTIEVTEEQDHLLRLAAWSSYQVLLEASENDTTSEDELVDFHQAQLYKDLIDEVWGPEEPTIGLKDEE